MNSNEYNVYIDEAGDEGLNKGSKYFILTAIIVSKNKDLIISKEVDNIKNVLEIDIKKQLHWNSIKGFPNKLMILEKIGNQDIKIVNVIIDTKSIKVIPSNNIYFFFSGYLFERITWIMKENNGKANIIISSRGNLSKKKLLNYINFHNHNKFEIDSKLIKDIKIIPNERKKLLQFADCCCSSLFQALKYNNSIHFEYISKIQNNIYVKNNNYVSYGLKIVPSDAKAYELYNLISYLLNKKK